MHTLRNFPNSGCKQAFDCGKEFIIAGGTPDRVYEALTFCDTSEEEAFFLLGCAEECEDLITTEEA